MPRSEQSPGGFAGVIVAISGAVGSGKSTLASELAATIPALHVRTQQLLANAALSTGVKLESSRRDLQEFGERLDRDTDEQWVADGVVDALTKPDVAVDLVIVDAVRTRAQIDHLRRRFPDRLRHIHLTAPRDVLARRYAERDSGLQELADYAEVAQNATEFSVYGLGEDADVSIDTDRCTHQDVVARAIAGLGMFASRDARLVDIIIGGQYGSEGKGNVAYHLAGEYDVLMRVGGPNAGHKVPSDPPFTHRSLPSGTLANTRAQLLIGPGATLDVAILLEEIRHCGVSSERLTIDPQAMIIEHDDLAQEEGLRTTIASTGRGGGSATARRILGRGTDNVRLARDVEELRPYVRSTSRALDDAFREGRRVMLEGTQGSLLSLYHGFYPWVTSRDTTTAACLSEAGIGPHRLRRVVMVIRTYPIRVGNPPASTSGSMSQEIEWSEVASRAGLDVAAIEEVEKGSVSNSPRRVAEFDWELLRRASELNGATDIALTFTDYLDAANVNARRFDQLTSPTIQFVEEVGRVGGAPVSLISTGFDRRPLIDRREW